MWIEHLEYCFTFRGLDVTTPADWQAAEVMKTADYKFLEGHDLRELCNALEVNRITYTEAKEKIDKHYCLTRYQQFTAERYKFSLWDLFAVKKPWSVANEAKNK